MTKLFKKGILLILLLSLTSIGNAQKIYSFGKEFSGYSGYLPDSLYNDLRRFLGQTSKRSLKDSLFIKYYFNNDTGCENSNKFNEKFIISYIKHRQSAYKREESARPNITILNYREPGEKVDKEIIMDQSINIDSSNYLKNLFLKSIKTCGSSIIVMPDNRFVVFQYDPLLRARFFSPPIFEIAIEISSKGTDK